MVQTGSDFSGMNFVPDKIRQALIQGFTLGYGVEPVAIYFYIRQEDKIFYIKRKEFYIVINRSSGNKGAGQQ
jgi:hypothetical protein